jgi:hypothetical protein
MAAFSAIRNDDGLVCTPIIGRMTISRGKAAVGVFQKKYFRTAGNENVMAYLLIIHK